MSSRKILVVWTVMLSAMRASWSLLVAGREDSTKS